MSRLPAERIKAFFLARLSPEGKFGIRLTVGMLVLMAASWIFGSIAEDVFTADEITFVDLNIANWFHAHMSPGVTTFMMVISQLHGVFGITIMSVLAAILFIRGKEHYWFLALVVTVAGGMLVNTLIKTAFHRARPSFSDPILTLTSYSFPSGHTAGAMLFYGVLCAFAVSHVSTRAGRTAMIVFSLLMVGLVALSRLYLGAHYLSDVLAAAAESIAWLALSLTSISVLRRRRRMRAHS